MVSLALQLARDPRVGLRLLRQYGELPPEVLAELLSHNTCGGGVEAAVEALLVQPLQVGCGWALQVQGMAGRQRSLVGG